MSGLCLLVTRRTSFGPSPTAATAQTLGGSCQLGSTGLGSSPSAARAATATAAGLAGEATTTALAAGTRRAVEPAAATTAGTAARSVVVGTAVGVSLGAALLNHDVLAIHSVGVGGESGSISGLSLELDESAVLGNTSQTCPKSIERDIHTFWRLISK